MNGGYRLDVGHLNNVAQVGAPDLLQPCGGYDRELLPVRPGQRQVLTVGRGHRLGHGSGRVLGGDRGGRRRRRGYLHLLQLPVRRYDAGHLGQELRLRLYYVGHRRGGGQLHREVYGLVDGLAVAGGDRHLYGDCLLHRELHDLWQ